MDELLLGQLPYVKTDIVHEVAAAFRQKKPESPYLRSLILADRHLVSLLSRFSRWCGLRHEEYAEIFKDLRFNYTSFRKGFEEEVARRELDVFFPVLGDEISRKIIRQMTSGFFTDLETSLRRMWQNNKPLYYRAKDNGEIIALRYDNPNLVTKAMHVQGIQHLAIEWQLVLNNVRSKEKTQEAYLR